MALRSAPMPAARPPVRPVKKTAGGGGGIVALVLLVAVSAGVNGYFHHSQPALPKLITKPYGIPNLPAAPVNPFSSPNFNFTPAVPAVRNPLQRVTPSPGNMQWSAYGDTAQAQPQQPVAPVPVDPTWVPQWNPSSGQPPTQRSNPYYWNPYYHQHPPSADPQKTEGHRSAYGK
jgi:hypothetical protein